MTINNNKLIVLMDSYYPDPRATTHIMRRLLESLCDRYKIYVFCLELLGHDVGSVKPNEHNGIFIQYAKQPLSINALKHCFFKINEKYIRAKYSRKYGTPYYYEKLYFYSLQIKKIIKKKGIKRIISVASPTDVHICAEMVVASIPQLSWFPVSFDPHAYDYRYSESMRNNYKREEAILYRKASRIFFLKQSEYDYKDSSFRDKITYFDLPLFFQEDSAVLKKDLTVGSNECVKLVYSGSIYKSIRNPDYMLELFSELKDVDFKIYFVGALYGWGDDLPTYIQKWKNRLGDKIEFIERISREEVAKYFNLADIFINIGNTTYNQCPSKVLDYVATGKPIIHFKKIENCSSMAYLKKYPNVCVADECEDIAKSAVLVKTFIADSFNKRLETAEIKELFKECEVSYIAGLFSEFIGSV